MSYTALYRRTLPHQTLCSVSDYGGSSGSGAVILDDCNFHESVHLDSFDVDRTLSLVNDTRRSRTVSVLVPYENPFCLNWLLCPFCLIRFHQTVNFQS